MANLVIGIQHDELVNFLHLLSTDDDLEVYARACFDVASRILDDVLEIQDTYFVKMEY